MQNSSVWNPKIYISDYVLTLENQACEIEVRNILTVQ